MSDKDEIILEDNLQRIKVLFDDETQTARLVTDTVCGVLGRETASGKFQVKLNPSPERPF